MSAPQRHPASGRRTVTLAGAGAWVSRSGTTTVDAHGEVALVGAPVGPPSPWPENAPRAPEPGGLCFDDCWVYHGEPDRGQVVREPWPGQPGRGPEDLLPSSAPRDEPPAAFRSSRAGLPDLRAHALATDDRHRLYVLDRAAGSIGVVDLLDGRMLSHLAVERPAGVDLASAGPHVLVALASRIRPVASVDPVAGTVRALVPDPAATSVLERLPAAALPTRVAVAPDRGVWLLLRAGTRGWVLALSGPRAGLSLELTGAADLELDGEGNLVVAGPAGADLRVFRVGAAVVETGPLEGRRYDGRGLARTPQGRIGTWTDKGFRTARPYRRSYLGAGEATTWAVDAQHPRQVWGRVFIEACVPTGTRLEIGFASVDDVTRADDAVGPPGRVPPADEVAAPLTRSFPVHRRETGREVPWAPLPRGDRYEVYECPVMAPPGRFLWLRLHLWGTATTTPRVRTVRVECDTHGLLEQLPRLYRDDPVAAPSLRRYLALVDGLLRDLEWRALDRDRLLEPASAPAELLPWVASLIGLTLDSRWSERARRTVLDEAICLYRSRGTLEGLRRLLEIYLDAPVTILEAFRVKGYGGAFVGGADTEPSPSSAVVGTSYRVGGDPAEGGGDAFATHAHRFTVLVSRDLCGDERAVLHDLLALNRPAHTLVELCDTSRGMRVGMSLHVQLSTVVGRDARFVPAVVGAAAVGSGAVLGRGHAGVRPGVTRLDDSTVVDP